MMRVRRGPAPSTPLRTTTVDRRPGLAADPAGDLVDVVAGRWSCRRRSTMMSPARTPAFSAGLPRRRRRSSDGRPRRVDPRRRSRRTSRTGRSARAAALLGRQERGVAGVADRLGQALDRAVGQGPVVELVARDVLLVERVPGLADEANSGRERRRARGRRRRHRGVPRRADPDPDDERQRRARPDDRPAGPPTGVRGRPPVTPEPGRGRARRGSRPVVRRRWSVRSGSGRVRVGGNMAHVSCDERPDRRRDPAPGVCPARGSMTRRAFGLGCRVDEGSFARAPRPLASAGALVVGCRT